MEELLIKVENEKESSSIKKSGQKIPFESMVKESVLEGQKAYKDGKSDQFKKITGNDLWR